MKVSSFSGLVWSFGVAAAVAIVGAITHNCSMPTPSSQHSPNIAIDKAFIGMSRDQAVSTFHSAVAGDSKDWQVDMRLADVGVSSQGSGVAKHIEGYSLTLPSGQILSSKSPARSLYSALGTPTNSGALGASKHYLYFQWSDQFLFCEVTDGHPTHFTLQGKS